MPRILRSPGSKSFRLENVSVSNADGARCERRRHLRRPKAKSALGQKRRFDRAPITSGLPPINRHSQSSSACLKGANRRTRAEDAANRRPNVDL
jgi:hypothetical protein